MAVIFVEGFTGFPRESATSALSSLLSGGYLLPTTYNDGNAPYPAASRYDVLADAIFADRNVMRMIKNSTSATAQEVGINVPYNFATNPAKVVLGFTLTCGMPANATAKYANSILIGTAYSPSYPRFAMMYTATGAARTKALVSETFAVIDFNDSATAAPNAGIKVPSSGTASAFPFTPNAQHHVELLIEQDVNRIRMYVDGTLAGDGAFAGEVGNMNSGFAIVTRSQTTGADKYAEVGNIYALAVDSVHTGPLGPTARVLEFAPASDAAVQWGRDESKYASNAAVVAQNFNGSDFVTAMDVGTTDLFNAPTGVGANAAQVFGVGIKVAAKSLTDATHAIKATVKVNGVSLDSAEAALPLNTNTVFTRDGSINPNTNAVWKPTEVAAGQFGYKLSK